MCGIAGLLGRLDGQVLKRLSKAIAHRGPDGEGVWQDEAAGIGLVHRRLSIIDLTPAAAQPMISRDGRYVTVFNGEIYNYRSLARTLSARGYAFNSNSDTAVLAPLFDHKGPDMLQDLEGIFAFAIWDCRAGSLFLARDHAGVKPFYYSIAGNRLAFASELRAVREAIDTISADTEAMAQYLSLLWTPGERTLFNEIRKLRPGHYVTAAFNGGALRTNISRWYRPPQAPIVNNRPVYDKSRKPDRLLGLLDRVVGEQCVSDVPIGAFLSGGVDSSAVVASMVATGHRPAQTYCVGFSGDALSREGFDDDLKYARRAAKHLGVPLKEIVIEEAGLVDLFPGLAVLLDEPTADSAPLLTQMVASQARSDNIKVLLSGTGGDDVFSGYRRHLAASLRERTRFWGSLLAAGTSLLGRVSTGSLRRRAGKLAGLIGDSNDNAFLLHAFSGNSVPGATGLLKTGIVRDPGDFDDNALVCALEECKGQSLLNRMLYLELFGFLPDHNLNYTDKTCMISGVETRVPLVDHRFLDFMAHVPPSLKTRGMALKWFFKRALRDRLPAGILTRKKVGFGAPIRQLLTAGKGRAMIEDTLFSQPMIGEYFDRPRLERFWKDTAEGRADGVPLALTIAMMGWIWDGLEKSSTSAPRPYNHQHAALQ